MKHIKQAYENKQIHRNCETDCSSTECDTGKDASQ